LERAKQENLSLVRELEISNRPSKSDLEKARQDNLSLVRELEKSERLSKSAQDDLDKTTQENSAFTEELSTYRGLKENLQKGNLALATRINSTERESERNIVRFASLLSLTLPTETANLLPLVRHLMQPSIEMERVEPEQDPYNWSVAVPYEMSAETSTLPFSYWTPLYLSIWLYACVLTEAVHIDDFVALDILAKKIRNVRDATIVRIIAATTQLVLEGDVRIRLTLRVSMSRI
jgi:hypothetical protein